MDNRHGQAYDAIIGDAELAETVMDFRDALAHLVGKSSQQRVADALGVPRRTLRRWLAGENQPNAARRALVQQAAAKMVDRSSLPEDRRQAVRRWTSVKVTGTLIVSDEAEDRDITFKVGRDAFVGLSGDPFRAMLDKFLAGAPAYGGPEVTNGIFSPVIAAMRDDWYRDKMQSDAPDEGFRIGHLEFR